MNTWDLISHKTYGIGQGDVIGCLLRLPPALGADDMATTKVAATTEVRFFLNGRDLGSAYRGFASGLTEMVQSSRVESASLCFVTVM